MQVFGSRFGKPAFRGGRRGGDGLVFANLCPMFDRGMIVTACAPIVVGDQLYFYFGGTDRVHDATRSDIVCNGRQRTFRKVQWRAISKFAFG